MSTRDLHLYKKNIVDFETDFVFSVVAEIPQYKKVFEKMVFAFNLDKLYKNVYDPIVELNDRQKDRSDKIIAIIGIAFTVLSLLSIVADGYQVLQIFEWINADWIVILKIVIFAFVVLLIISALQIIKILFRRK